MVKIVTQEQKDGLANSYPYGDKWQKRKVIKVTMKDAWYKIGYIITVKHFATYGAYDEKDRWVDYYDLGPEIN